MTSQAQVCFSGYTNQDKYFTCIVHSRLEEGGVLTDCSIQTQEPDETLDFDFSSADVLNKIIMKVRKQLPDKVEL